MQFKSKKAFFQKSPKHLKMNLLLSPLLVVVFLFALLPIILSTIQAFKVFSPGNRLDYAIGISNFQNVWNDFAFQKALENTSIIIFLATPIAMFCAFLFAWLISSIVNKFLRFSLITLLYAQFFISTFAIGLSFIFLFGTQNQFFSLFKINASFQGSQPLPITLLYSLFQFWRIVPFNIALFALAFSKANLKYQKMVQVDQLKKWAIFKSIYFFHLKKSFLALIYFNLLSAALLFPNFIVDFDVQSVLNSGHTLISYLLEILNPTDGELINNAFASAASIMILLYILSIIVSTFLLFSSPKIFHHFRTLFKWNNLQNQSNLPTKKVKINV